MQEGVYVISVAARILDMHPQTLRKYERVGLVLPSRTMGMSRLYSDEDIARLQLIKHLVENLGLNLAGVQVTMQLFNRMIKMRAQMTQLEGQPLREALNESLDEMFKILAG
jgi:MerR family transcriptional regulator/heat shock protein HspR